MKLAPYALAALALATTSFTFHGQEQWVTFQAPGCKVLFPKAPSAEVDTVNTAIGALQVKTYMYEVPDADKDNADNWTYGLFETVYPDKISSSSDQETLKRFFDGCENGAAGNVHGKVLSDSTIQLNGYPGRAFRVDYGNGQAVITMRCYLVHHTMFMLQTITDSKKDLNGSMGRFMASLVLEE